MVKLFAKNTLLIVALLFIFSSCNDEIRDPFEAGNELIGKWEFVSISANVETDDPETTKLIENELLNDSEKMGYINFIGKGIHHFYDPAEEKEYAGIYFYSNIGLVMCFKDKKCEESTWIRNGSLSTQIFYKTVDYRTKYPEAGVKKAEQVIERRKQL